MNHRAYENCSTANGTNSFPKKTILFYGLSRVKWTFQKLFFSAVSSTNKIQSKWKVDSFSPLSFPSGINVGTAIGKTALATKATASSLAIIVQSNSNRTNSNWT